MIEIIKIQNKKYFIIGTDHVSKKNIQKVSESIKKYKPDAIAIELCKNRYKKIMYPKYFEKIKIEDIIKNGQIMLMLSSFFLSSYQQKISNIIGIRPGAEINEAINIAKKDNIPLILIDQNIEIIFNKIINKLTFFEKIKLLYQLFLFYSNKKIKFKNLIHYKTNDNFINKKNKIEKMLKDINNNFPSIKKYLIDKRDIYLSYKISKIKNKKILVIVGTAHIEGIKNHLLSADINSKMIKELNKINKNKKNNIFIISIFILTIGFLISIIFFKKFIFFELSDLKYWLLWTCFLGGFGAFLGGGHPLTILAAIIGSPIGIILPFLTSGMISALVEAKINKPKINDFKLLNKDILTFNGWRKNYILKIISILFLTSFGTIIGNIVGLKNVFDKFLNIFK